MGNNPKCKRTRNSEDMRVKGSYDTTEQGMYIRTRVLGLIYTTNVH